MSNDHPPAPQWLVDRITSLETRLAHLEELLTGPAQALDEKLQHTFDNIDAMRRRQKERLLADQQHKGAALRGTDASGLPG